MYIWKGRVAQWIPLCGHDPSALPKKAMARSRAEPSVFF